MSTTITRDSDTLTKKSGKGLRHGVASEVSAFFHVKPGHEAELRAACGRFHQRLTDAPLDFMQRFGLQDMRHVIFDNGTRLHWATSFDTDWDPYIDDSVTTLGLKTWYDWFQHCEECPKDFLDLNLTDLKTFIQSGQVQATGFFKSIPDATIGEIRKARRVQAAFEQVLENPTAAQALSNPVLKPLLDQAAD
jgi:hypothetical protein